MCVCFFLCVYCYLFLLIFISDDNIDIDVNNVHEEIENTKSNIGQQILINGDITKVDKDNENTSTSTFNQISNSKDDFNKSVTEGDDSMTPLVFDKNNCSLPPINKNNSSDILVENHEKMESKINNDESNNLINKTDINVNCNNVNELLIGNNETALSSKDIINEDNSVSQTANNNDTSSSNIKSTVITDTSSLDSVKGNKNLDSNIILTNVPNSINSTGYEPNSLNDNKCINSCNTSDSLKSLDSSSTNIHNTNSAIITTDVSPANDNNSNSIINDDQSSVIYTVTDILKTVKVTSSASQDSNEQNINILNNIASGLDDEIKDKITAENLEKDKMLNCSNNESQSQVSSVNKKNIEPPKKGKVSGFFFHLIFYISVLLDYFLS